MRVKLGRTVGAAWMRGGTSKGLFFNAEALPAAGAARDRVLLAAIGPDASGMQIDGVGGGISSTSKTVIVGNSTHAGCDIDYTFGQVALNSQRIEWDQNCGNLASAVGLFARREGLIDEESLEVRVWQTNTRERMVLRLPARGAEQIRIPGVPGTAPPIWVGWVAPGIHVRGRGVTSPVEELRWRGGPVEATLVEAANHAIIFRAADLGLEPPISSAAVPWVEVDGLRAEAATLLGIELSSAMRVVLVAPPHDYTASDGSRVAASDADLCAWVTTDGHRIHHAFTGTGSINLAAAAAAAGSVPHQLLRPAAAAAPLRIGHPGGVMEVVAEVEPARGSESARRWSVREAGFFRTARFLMTGEVHID